MRSKLWAGLIGLVLAICLGLSVWVMWPRTASRVEVRSDGRLLKTLSLEEDCVLTVKSAEGINTVTVKNGKVAVTQADCPDHYCMDRGFCSGGAQIVCLPNRLVLKFADETEVDGVAG